ncbi:MAG: hypothetical protein ICV63_13180 [Coleofasciculus sp. Co-bin14]|nr:hypothetical protein [Coleofasciculus sp. Co-bin14]
MLETPIPTICDRVSALSRRDFAPERLYKVLSNVADLSLELNFCCKSNKVFSFAMGDKKMYINQTQQSPLPSAFCYSFLEKLF